MLSSFFRIHVVTQSNRDYISISQPHKLYTDSLVERLWGTVCEMFVSLSDFKAKREGTALCKLKLWFSYLLTQLEAEVT